MTDSQDILIGILTHLSRSGSTLLSRMLDDFEEICVTTESELPLELFGVKSYTPIVFEDQESIENYLEHSLQTTRIASWKLSTANILERCQEYGYPIIGPTLFEILLSVYRSTHKPDAKMVIYKACPFMPWHIPESMDHFTDAKFLHLLRDPRAVFHSQKHSIDPFTGKPYSTSTLKTAMDWRKAAGLSEYHGKIMELRYEDLIASPEKTIQNVLTFLDLKQAKKALGGETFIDRMEVRDKQLHQEITQAPNSQKNETWKQNLTPSEIEIIDSYLSDTMQLKGYSPFSPDSARTITLSLKISLGIFWQRIFTLYTRSRRVLQHLFTNPGHFLHKVRLKISHD